MPRERATWHPKEYDDVIIERWTKACSEIHNDCYGCPFEEDCQDLVDRLIVRLYMRLRANRSKS